MIGGHFGSFHTGKNAGLNLISLAGRNISLKQKLA
jgi:hypothetical protein